VNQQQIQAEFRRQQAKDQSLHSSQFSINFPNGEVVFMRPELMEKKNGFPVYKPEEYLRKNHPQKLGDFQKGIAHREGEIRRTVDKPLSERREKTTYESFFGNY
jgi:hypothetical protein